MVNPVAGWDMLLLNEQLTAVLVLKEGLVPGNIMTGVDGNATVMCIQMAEGDHVQHGPMQQRITGYEVSAVTAWMHRFGRNQRAIEVSTQTEDEGVRGGDHPSTSSSSPPVMPVEPRPRCLLEEAPTQPVVAIATPATTLPGPSARMIAGYASTMELEDLGINLLVPAVGCSAVWRNERVEVTRTCGHYTSYVEIPFDMEWSLLRKLLTLTGGSVMQAVLIPMAGRNPTDFLPKICASDTRRRTWWASGTAILSCRASPEPDQCCRVTKQ